jgi:hypothetical protein
LPDIGTICSPLATLRVGHFEALHFDHRRVSLTDC